MGNLVIDAGCPHPGSLLFSLILRNEFGRLPESFVAIDVRQIMHVVFRPEHECHQYFDAGRCTRAFRDFAIGICEFGESPRVDLQGDFNRHFGAFHAADVDASADSEAPVWEPNHCV